MWYNRVMKPKQVDFKAAKASDIPLNGKQLDMLVLIADAGADGALVYGRGPTETVAALLTRCLVTPKDGSVAVVIMGRLEYRKLYVLTAKGQGMLA
jgi:hypothetical protein